jgi:capsular exopolysaccharide synthesis family protein
VAHGLLILSPVTRPMSDVLESHLLHGALPTAAPAAPTHASDPRYEGKLLGRPKLPLGVTEDYEALAASLDETIRRSGKRIILVSSALPGEGKTLVASNLATAFSTSYSRRVLLIDCDLRRPSVHLAFGLPPAPGLAESLKAEDIGAIPVFRTTPTLSILVAGRCPHDPMRIVAGAAMQRVLRQAAVDYDTVIVDTPPVGLLADAAVLAAFAENVVLVVKAGSTPYDAVLSAIKTLGPDRLLGCVLNQADASETNPFRYSSQAGDYYYRAPDSGS